MLVKDLISCLEYPVDVIAINAFDADGSELYIPFDGFESEEIPERILDSEVKSYWISFQMNHKMLCEIEVEYQLNIILDNIL